ncbi:MAG TPA: D-aminoacyl-tRNA deacylase [Phycisphaerae bacterium]|nr:D-aminoacyl-tRNA deacylase [Phycisphaerae bacterium]
MRAVVQRVSSAAVKAGDDYEASIAAGLLVYLGVSTEDGEAEARAMAEKVRYLRIFDDEGGQLNLDVVQAGGSVLVVSAFTTLGDARKGRRPSYVAAAKPEQANELYTCFCDALEALGLTVRRGVFRAYMEVSSTNDGPVCILVDSTKAF